MTTQTTIKLPINSYNKAAYSYLVAPHKIKTDNKTASYIDKIIAVGGTLYCTNGLVATSINDETITTEDIPDGYYTYEKTAKSLFLTESNEIVPNIESLYHMTQYEKNPYNQESKVAFCWLCSLGGMYNYSLYDKIVNHDSPVRAYLQLGSDGLIRGDSVAKLGGSFNDNISYSSLLMPMNIQ